MADLETYFSQHLTFTGPAYVNSRGHRERKAVCRFHDDAKGSLGIDLEDGVLHCFGCGWSGNVKQFAEKLGVKPPETWQPSRPRTTQPARKPTPAPTLRPLGEEARKWLAGNGKGYAEATLAAFRVQETTQGGESAVVIPAEGGVLRLYFWRRPKEKRWQSWPLGAGGSVVGGDCTGPELLVAEGEWDCLAAYDRGFQNVLTGTTGAGSFPSKHLNFFEGKKVTIAFDNDEPGKKGAEKLAREILAGCRKATVKIAEVPAGAWEGTDVSDFFAGGNTADDFRELLASAKDYRPPSKTAVNFSIDEAADLLALRIADPPHVVARLLPEQGGLLVVADGGVGKSMATLELGLRVALGQPVLGFEVRRARKVAIFSLENSRLLTAARLQHMARGLAIEPETLREQLVLVHDLRLNLNNMRDRKLLMEVAEQIGAGLYIFDPAISFLGSADENKSHEVRAVLDTITQVCRRLDAAAVICHHLAKNTDRDLRSRIRGASDFYNWADVVLTLEKKSPAQAPDAVLAATCLKCRAMREPPPFLVRRSSQTFLHEVVQEEALCSPARVEAVLKNTFGGHCDTKTELVAKLMELTGASDRTVKNAVTEAVAGGLLEESTIPGNRRAKALSLPKWGNGEPRPATVPLFSNPSA